MLNVFKKYTELDLLKSQEYIRWLMLISTGAFSVSITVLFGKSFSPASQIILKAAISANAAGILFGAISASGEAKLMNLAKKWIATEEIRKIKGENVNFHNDIPYVSLPKYILLSEKLCYSSLFASLFLWVAFVWLQ